MRDARAARLEKKEKKKKKGTSVFTSTRGRTVAATPGFHGPRRAAGSFASPRIYGG